MKKFKGISLRLRLTLLTALIMVLVAGVLTVGSITRADSYFIPDNYSVKLAGPIATDSKEYTIHSSVEGEKPRDDSLIIEMSKIASFKTKEGTAEQIKDEDILITETPSETYPSQSATYQLEAITLTTAAKKNFAFSSTWMMLFAMIAGVFLTWVMAGRALKPVTALAKAVDTIDEHNLSTRIHNIQSHDEIQQLTDSFNHMLDKLEQAFVQQRTFAANAAHEFKTPLAAIRTNLEVLELEEKPSLEDYQETMDIINRNSERLITLVGNLLELNDQQNMNLFERVSTEKMINQLLTEQTAAIAEKRLEISIDNQLPYLFGNEQLLTSALRNLLENAIKYHHAEGHICLILKKESDKAQITVWDDGPGISEEQLPHIFEPFYRCDPSRSSKIKGSGLGLSLVQTIVQRHNGSINVHSSSENGISFTIILPNQVQDLNTL